MFHGQQSAQPPADRVSLMDPRRPQTVLWGPEWIFSSASWTTQRPPLRSVEFSECYTLCTPLVIFTPEEHTKSRVDPTPSRLLRLPDG